MIKTLYFVFILLLSISSVLRAEWVRVTGVGEISEGKLPAARAVAKADALQKITSQYTLKDNGWARSAMNRSSNGWLSASSKASMADQSQSANADSAIRRIRVVNEQVEGGKLMVTFDIDIVSRNYCGQAAAGGYKKRVGLLGFTLQDRSHASLGGLHDIERGLSATLTEQLVHSGHTLPFSASQIRLYDEVINAPTHETNERLLSHAVAEARELGVQFIVSGVIRTIALRDQDAFASSLVRSSMRLLDMTDLQRDFVVDLFIHDGFSGSLLFENRYQTSGSWAADKTSRVSFMSANFLALDYGRKVQQQLQLMALDIEASTDCQPYMTRITGVEDRVIVFGSGASAGIKPGDKFQLYRARQLYQGSRFQGNHLMPLKQVVQVSQVQPDFSMGLLNTDPTRINIQQDDVLVRW